MAPGGDFIRAKNTAFQKLPREILVWICRHFTVGRKKACLRTENDFLARESLGGKFPQSRANGTFAALQPVVDGGINYVETAFHRSDYGIRVSAVRRLIRFAEVCTNAHG